VRTRCGLALLALAAALACGGDPQSPEERVRAVVAAFEEAATTRDIGMALDLVSESYRDSGGRDKQAIKGLVVSYFLRNEAIYVISRIRSLELDPSQTSASLVVVSALTGAPVADPGELAGLAADLYRFEIDVALEDDDTWRITRADWRPTTPGEML
jgi:hypothetical protein